MSIMFCVKDRHDPGYKASRASVSPDKACPSRVVTRKGKDFAIGQESVELFSVTVLLEAIDRGRMWLIKAEKDGIIPKPMFVLPDTKRRHYSGAQILNLHRLIWGKYQLRKNNTLDVRQLTKDIHSVFYENQVCVGEDGTINIQYTRVGGK